MKDSQMNKTEGETYVQLMDKTKLARRKHQHRLVIASIVVSLAVLRVTIWYWTKPNVAYSTSLSLAGHLCGLYGALLLAVGAVSKPSTIGLMSMTRYCYNSKLFTELMNSRLNARIGVIFIVIAFSIHSATILTLEN